jgi:anti-sigma factor ChrR (cupin superfamily)
MSQHTEDVLNQYFQEERPSNLFLPQLYPEALNPKDVKTTSRSRTNSIWRPDAAQKSDASRAALSSGIDELSSASHSAEETTMTATTPFLKQAEKLGPLASRYVEVESLPWKPTPCSGIDMKILLEDTESGLLTALFRWQPGAELALHEHVEVEQTFVLEGSLVDDEGEVRAGNYVLRPKGNRHIARSPNGALVLSMFLKPNIFLAGDAAGRDLR